MTTFKNYKKIDINGYTDIIKALSDRITALENLISVDGGVKKIASDAQVIVKEGEVEYTTNLFDVNSDHLCTMKDGVLPYIQKISHTAVIDIDSKDTRLMNDTGNMFNTDLYYEGGEGGILPDGLSYDKTKGEFTIFNETNHSILSISSLAEGTSASTKIVNLFDPDTKKISKTLYDSALPNGLDFTDGILTISNPDTSNTKCGINIKGVLKANSITYEQTEEHQDGTSGCILLETKEASILVASNEEHSEIIVDDTGLDKDNVKYALNHEDKTCVCMGYQGEDKESLTNYDGMQSKAYVSYNNERYEIIEYYENAFKDCKNLEIHHLPDTIKVLGKHCFDGCESSQLESLPEQLEEIRDYALAYNKQMTSLLFSSYVRKIESHVVFGNLHLKNIDLTKCMYLQQISKFAFDGANGSRVLITKDQHKKWSSFINTNKKGLKTIASVEMITV